MKKQEAAENKKILEETLQKWQVFKKHFLKAFTQEPISPEDEQEFLEIKSQVNKNSRILGQRLKTFGYEGDKISAILRQCISVSQLRALPVSDRRGLYKEWHAICVNLYQTDGALGFIEQGWIPRVIEAKAGTSISDIKRMGGAGGAKKKKGKKGLIFALIAVGIIVVVGVAWFLTQ